MPRLDSMRCIAESMKASRFALQCSAAVQLGFVGAFVVVSLLSAIQPVQAHGDGASEREDRTSGVWALQRSFFVRG